MTPDLASVPSALHVGADDVPWVEDAATGTASRLVHVRLGEGLYVQHARFPAGFDVARHRHTGAVLAVTFGGAWGYKENDFLCRAGSYLYEPEGSTHSLFTPDSNDEPTEVMFAITGDVLYLDDDDRVIDRSNARRALERYLAACETAGHGYPDRLLRSD